MMSWDDGHFLDLCVVQMFSEYGLVGIFYMFKCWCLPTMDDAQLRELADAGFELGGHIIDHVVLTHTFDDEVVS